jgi:transglutaminase-like putative cysteine protease
VHDSLRAEAVPPGRTARSAIAARAGDAREFALAFTALARAAGVPARLVSGLLYHDGRFYAHAWSMAYVGRWVPVDPMLGQVPADASHLDFGHDMVDLGPEIVRVLNRVELTVVGSTRSF